MGTDGMLLTTKLEALRNDEMVGSSTNSNSKKLLVKEKSVSDSKGGDKDIISVCDYIDLTKACDVINWVAKITQLISNKVKKRYWSWQGARGAQGNLNCM